MDKITNAPVGVRGDSRFYEIKNVLVLIFATLFYTITTYIFVLENDFAPSGLSGILAKIAAKSQLTIGSFVLLLINKVAKINTNTFLIS